VKFFDKKSESMRVDTKHNSIFPLRQVSYQLFTFINAAYDRYPSYFCEVECEDVLDPEHQQDYSPSSHA
jgi:hypothetical protein